MSICAICDREVDDTVPCNQCGADFCEFCGDNIKKLCDMCREHDDEFTGDDGVEY